MPGLSFICDLKGDLIKEKSTIFKSLNSLLHSTEYEQKVLLNKDPYFLACTKYKEYPLSSFEDDKFLIYFEGEIYGKDYHLLNIELNNLAKLVFQPHVKIKDKIVKWLLNTDGDFIVFILNKESNEIVIISDALGRLPLYYYKGNGKLMVSRELRFITNLVKSIEFDKMAIAQYLLFKYPLGKRTLLKNIFRVGSATIIRIKINDFQFEFENIHQFNFENKKYKERTIEENANKLVKIFNEACKNRTKSAHDYKKVLSLSGGLDSRSIGACLQKNDIPFYGVTFIDFDETTAVDSEIAEQVAKEFVIDWKLIKLGPPKGKDFLKLLKIKNGMNYLSMSFILPFFNKIKETYGSRIIYFTGDGGDKLLPDLRPYKKLKNINDLVNFVVSDNQTFIIDDVAALTKIKKSDILKEIKTHLLSYPEIDWNQKYVHFLIYERGFKWLFEGEDRNRFYFWSVTPFYPVQFFNYAMNCPDDQKSKYALYRNFLMKLSPQASAIDISHWKLPFTSKKFIIKLWLRSLPSRVPLKLRRRIKMILRKNESYEINSCPVRCFQEQINNSKSVQHYLTYAAMEDIIKKCSKIQFNTLFTITSSIEEIENNNSTIKKYYESNFI